MTPRYTFAVCTKCGVASPPILLPSHYPSAIALTALTNQGWKCQSFTHNITALCPKCRNEEEAAADPRPAA